MLINLILVFSISLLLLVLIFVIQKQRIIRSAQRPIPRPKVALRRKANASLVSSAGAPEKAIKAVTVYTHDRAAAERLLQSYSRTHGHKGWDGVVDQVIRDLVRDRRQSLVMSGLASAVPGRERLTFTQLLSDRQQENPLRNQLSASRLPQNNRMPF